MHPIINKDRILKKILENKEMDFKNWVINIQAAGYNGAYTVYQNHRDQNEPCDKGQIKL